MYAIPIFLAYAIVLEANVTIKAKEIDQNIVESLLGACVADYKQISGKEVQLKLDNESFLPADTTGGVELTAQRGKIKVVNTLESRLELIAQKLVPQIRVSLFGRNANRKFTD